MKRIQQLAKKLNRGDLERLHAFARDAMPWVKDLDYYHCYFTNRDGAIKGLDMIVTVTKDTQPNPKPLTSDECELLSKIKDTEISAVLKMLSHLTKGQLQTICEGKEIKNTIIGTFDLKLILACISCLSKM